MNDSERLCSCSWATTSSFSNSTGSPCSGLYNAHEATRQGFSLNTQLARERTFEAGDLHELNVAIHPKLCANPGNTLLSIKSRLLAPFTVFMKTLSLVYIDITLWNVRTYPCVVCNCTDDGVPLLCRSCAKWKHKDIYHARESVYLGHLWCSDTGVCNRE